MIATRVQERRRFIRFAIVGAWGALLDFAVMNLLTRLADLELVAAGTISFTVAVLSNFLGNRHWTYPDSRSRHILRQLGMFFLVNLAGAAIRIPILHFFEAPIFRLSRRLIPGTTTAAELIAKNSTLALAICVVMLWNFFINRYWTYNDIDRS